MNILQILVNHHYNLWLWEGGLPLCVASVPVMMLIFEKMAENGWIEEFGTKTGVEMRFGGNRLSRHVDIFQKK